MNIVFEWNYSFKSTFSWYCNLMTSTCSHIIDRAELVVYTGKKKNTNCSWRAPGGRGRSRFTGRMSCRATCTPPVLLQSTGGRWVLKTMSHKSTYPSETDKRKRKNRGKKDEGFMFLGNVMFVQKICRAARTSAWWRPWAVQFNRVLTLNK